MSEEQHESWEHYSKLVLDVLERHDENLVRLEQEISGLRIESKHDLEAAITKLREDMKILKEALAAMDLST